MGDDVSQESVSTTDEYYVVNAKPKLTVSGNGDPEEVINKMSEILDEDNDGFTTPSALNKENPFNKEDSDTVEPASSADEVVQHREFHFPDVTYLGTAGVSAPKDQGEINHSLRELNSQAKAALKITLSIPDKAAGSVKLLDIGSGTDIASFALAHIAFCLRGCPGTEEARCFAFTYSHAAPGARHHNDMLYQCHAFRCKSEDERTRVMNRLIKAFYNSPDVPAKSIPNMLEHLDKIIIGLRLTVDIREEDNKGNYAPVPKEKGNVFKLRSNVDKKVFITIQQITDGVKLNIERCLGLFIGTGRFLDNSDVSLLEMDSMTGSDSSVFCVSGNWIPTEPGFALLNTETARDHRVFMTIGIHLLIQSIELPVSLKVVCKAKIFSEEERFWIFNKKPISEDCRLTLEETSDESGNVVSGHYRVNKIESVSDPVPHPLTSSMIDSTPLTPTDSEPPDFDEDDDEPLMSGTGQVSKEVTDEQILEAWADVLQRWHADMDGPRPKQVTALARKGVPEALRGEVWQLMAGSTKNELELQDAYRILITRDIAHDAVIRRDMSRTFPAHDHFKGSNSAGQESLFRVSKAYSIYDDEIGYCQGFSFLAASLLLHMPEEQAFCLLVKIMSGQNYGVRNLFRQNFEGLYLRLFQLERLLCDYIPDLSNHFIELNLEPHMYASQWFLTLFTAKFPLHAVFQILDMFLSEGMDVIFKVSLALLRTAKKDLLCLDFEGILKYFRVTLPKKYRSPDACKELIQTAARMKVNSKNLKKYEKQWQEARMRKAQTEDPQAVLESEIKYAKEENNRLERENDCLAEELVTSKINMQNTIDKLEDKFDIVTQELFATKKELNDASEDRDRLDEEIKQVKTMFRQEMIEKDDRLTKQEKIITEYKRITSDLSKRAEMQEIESGKKLTKLHSFVRSCSSCSSKLADTSTEGKEGDVSDDNLLPMIVDQDEVRSMRSQIAELEQEVAMLKVALVQSQCDGEAVSHKLSQIQQQQVQQQNSKTWLSKTFTSIRDKTRAATGAGIPGPGGAVSQSSSAPMGPPTSSQSLHGLTSWATSPDSYNMMSYEQTFSTCDVIKTSESNSP